MKRKETDLYHRRAGSRFGSRCCQSFSKNEKTRDTLCVFLFSSLTLFARDFTPLSTGSSGSFYREDMLYIYTSKRFIDISQKLERRGDFSARETNSSNICICE